MILLRNIVFVVLAFVIAIIAMINLYRPSPAIADFAKPADANATELARYDAAVKAFLETCAPIRSYWRDLEHPRVGPTDIYWQREAFGWTSALEVVLRVRENTRDVPNDWYANRHTLRYVLGAGPRGTGVIATKQVEKRFCGSDGKSSTSVLLPAAAFDFLKE